MKNTSGWEPIDNLIMVKPDEKVTKVSPGGIDLSAAEVYRTRENGTVTIGTVVAVGSGPWQRWDANDVPRPGERIIFKRACWAKLEEGQSDDGVGYWALQEDDVLFRRTDRRETVTQSGGELDREREQDHAA